MPISKSKLVALEKIDHKMPIPNLKLFKPCLKTIKEETLEQVKSEESKRQHTVKKG